METGQRPPLRVLGLLMSLKGHGGWGEPAEGLRVIPISLCKATGDEVGFFGKCQAIHLHIAQIEK